MNATLLTLYILVWPVICAILLAVLVGSVIRDWRSARKDGRDMV